MELFTRQAAVALFFGLFATSTQAKEFSYLETFDDAPRSAQAEYCPTDRSTLPSNSLTDSGSTSLMLTSHAQKLASADSLTAARLQRSTFSLQPFQRHLPSFPTVLTALLTLSTPSTKV